MNKTFSAHMLKTFRECPYKYYLEYEKKINIPQDNSQAETGKNIHALINYYLKGFNTEKLIGSLSERELQLWNNYLNLNIKNNNIFLSEYSFNIKINKKNWLTGRIDAISREGNSYTIYDWKTGNLPIAPDKDLQTMTYSIALSKQLNHTCDKDRVNSLRFVYMSLKTAESIDLIIPSRIIEGYSKTICAIIEELEEFSKRSNYPKLDNSENSNTNNKENASCESCKFKIICKTDVFL